MLGEIESQIVHKDEEGDQYRKKKQRIGWSKVNRNHIESQTVQKDEEGDQYRKKSKPLGEVKSIKIISNNLQSFLEISHTQKAVLPSIARISWVIQVCLT